MESNIDDVKRCLVHLVEDSTPFPRSTQHQPADTRYTPPDIPMGQPHGPSVPALQGQEHLPTALPSSAVPLLHNVRSRRKHQALPSTIIHRKPKKHKPLERLEFQVGAYITAVFSIA